MIKKALQNCIAIILSAIISVITIYYGNFLEKVSDIDNASLLISSSMTFITAITLWHQYNESINWSDVFIYERDKWLLENQIVKEIELEEIKALKMEQEIKNNEFATSAKNNDSKIKKKSIKSAIVLLLFGFILSSLSVFYIDKSMHIASCYFLTTFFLTNYYVCNIIYNKWQQNKNLKDLLDKSVGIFVANRNKSKDDQIKDLQQKLEEQVGEGKNNSTDNYDDKVPL
jgi:hypothetical protein